MYGFHLACFVLLKRNEIFSGDPLIHIRTLKNARHGDMDVFGWSFHIKIAESITLSSKTSRQAVTSPCGLSTCIIISAKSVFHPFFLSH